VSINRELGESISRDVRATVLYGILARKSVEDSEVQGSPVQNSAIQHNRVVCSAIEQCVAVHRTAVYVSAVQYSMVGDTGRFSFRDCAVACR
jgi:hypothetical protein